MLTMIDEFSRKRLTIYRTLRIGLVQVTEQLANVMIIHSIPDQIRSDNSPEFITIEIRKLLSCAGVKASYIKLGNHWENGFWKGLSHL